MVKKVLLLTLCLMFLLCGCGEQTQTSGNSQPQSNVPQVQNGSSQPQNTGSQPQGGSSQTGTASQTAPVGGDFKFWLSEVTCKAGQTCKVEVRVSAHSQVAASDLIIQFDSTKLSFEGFQAGGVYTSEAALQSAGKVKVTSITLNPPEEEALMGTLTFKALPGATGTVPLQLISETCANIDLVDMVPVCFKGSVTIES